MKNNQLVYIIGGVAAAISFIIFIILYIMGNNPFGPMSWIGSVIPVVFIFMGTKKIRDEQYEGIITYGQALLTGVIITFAWSLGFAILSYLFCKFIDIQILQWHIDELIVNIERAGEFIGEEMMEESISQIEKMSLFDIIQADFINKIIGGLIISLSVAGIVKRQKPMFE